MKVINFYSSSKDVSAQFKADTDFCSHVCTSNTNSTVLLDIKKGKAKTSGFSFCSLTKRKFKKKFFVREFSKKTEHLYFEQNVVNFLPDKFETDGYPFIKNRFTFSSEFSFKHKKSLYTKGAQLLPNIQPPFFKNNKGLSNYTLLATQRQNVLLKNKGSIFAFNRKSDQLLFAENHFYRSDFTRRLAHLYKTNFEKMSFLSSDLANLTLSLKTYTLLKQKGVHKIGNLIIYSEKALFELVNRNKKMFAEIKRCFLLIAIS